MWPYIAGGGAVLHPGPKAEAYRRNAPSKNVGIDVTPEVSHAHDVRSNAGECLVEAHGVAHAPAEVLVEGRGAVNIEYMSVTLWTAQPAASWSRPSIVVLTPEVSHAPMSWSKDEGAARTSEHRSDAGGVPRADVLVERRRGRVAGFVPRRSTKQVRHVRHPASRPRRKCGRTSPRQRTGRQTKPPPPF